MEYEESFYSYLWSVYASLKSKLQKISMVYSFLSWRDCKEFVSLKTRDWVQNLLETGKLSRSLKSTCDLVYHDGTNRYIVRFPKVRGPGKISRIESEGKDVTTEVRAYMGPCHNFHGIPTTPLFLGYSTLTFFLRDESTISFHDDEYITI